MKNDHSELDWNLIYFAGTPVIRKEHFGTLILMQNGRRHVTDNRYFGVLQRLAFQERKSNGGEEPLSDSEIGSFLADLEQLGVISRGITSGSRVSLIENPFISNDCLSFPRVVYWECTNNCNLRCVHCYSSADSKAAGAAIEKDRIFQLIDELSAHGCEFLCMGGGEPLLYPLLFDVVRRCSEKNLAVEMTTNGQLIDDSVLEQLKDAGLKFIQVSLDGALPGTYNSIRVNAEFEEVVKNAAKIAKHFVLSICTVAMRPNLREMENLIELSKQIGAEHFRVLPLMTIGRGCNCSHLALNHDELRELNHFLLKRKSEERSLHIQLNENLVVPERKNIEWMPEDHFGCSAGRSTCLIDAEGFVFPCSFMGFPEFRCGDLREHSLLNIWTHSEVLQNLRKLDHVEGKCSSCSYLPDCRGGCRAAAYMKYGSISAEDPLCTVGQKKP